MVAFRASGFRFSVGTFWYGANSTIAYDSLPGTVPSINPRPAKSGNVHPYLPYLGTNDHRIPC